MAKTSPRVAGASGFPGGAGGDGAARGEPFRRVLPPDLRESPREADISLICGLGASGRSDLSADKGRYIAEVIAADEIDRRQRP